MPSTNSSSEQVLSCSPIRRNIFPNNLLWKVLVLEGLAVVHIAFYNEEIDDLPLSLMIDWSWTKNHPLLPLAFFSAIPF